MPIPTIGNGIENWNRLPPPSGLGQVLHFEEVTGRDHARSIKGEKRLTRVFQVITSSPPVGSTTVIAFDQTRTPFPPPMVGSEFNARPQRRVPQAGDWYVELDADWNVVFADEHVVCVDVRAEQRNPDDLTECTVTASYAGDGDPLAEPADVSVVRVPYQKALIKDLKGFPVVNSASDPFEAGVMVDRHRFKLVIQKNVLSFNPWVWEPYQDSVNKFELVMPKLPPGIANLTGKLTFEAERVRRSGNADFYWRLKAEIDVNSRDGWKVRLRDCGYHFLNAAGKRYEIMLPRGGKPSTPQLLDGAGGILAVGGTPVEQVFDGYEEKDWGPLGIGAWI